MIMSEWKEYRLGDLCYKVCSGGTPKSTCSSYYEGGTIPWLNTKEINYNRIFETESHITEDGLNHSSAKWIDSNAVVVAMYGATAGRVAIAKVPMTTNQACCNLMIDSSKADYNFIYYYLSNSYKYLLSMANGAAQQNLNAQIIKDLFISLPSLDEQRSIASILSSLDSKIENNRKICANLETQAQALFKHWFIDFAPFKDGKFVESELGMIPEGWRVGKLGNIAYINPSRTLQKGSKATYLDMKNMPTIGPFPLSWDVKEYNGGMRFMNGDTIMARITPCLENGKVAYVNFLQNQEIAFGSTEYIIMSPKNNLFSEYLYFLCRNSSFINYATKNMNGSSGRQRVSGDTISNYDMIIAPKEIYKEVEPIFKDIMCHIKSLGQESILLSTLRDTLLPKLMSGEIKV